MKKTAFYKELFRSIGKSKARFLSILIIIAIGVGFYAGINATEPDMILSADKYFKNSRLADLHLFSPLGFDKEDISKIDSVDGINHIQEGFSKDLFVSTEEGNTYTARIYSFDPEDYKNGGGVNELTLMEGRYPDNTGEIVVEEGNFAPGGFEIGSEVVLSVTNGEDWEDSLKTQTFTIVGKIQSPLYINFERGNTNIGDGSIDFFAYLNEKDFAMEKPTDLYIETVQSAKLISYTKEYEDHLKPVSKELERLGETAMSFEIRKLKDEVADGWEELEENKRKLDDELKKAEEEINEGKKELAEQEQNLLDEEKRASDEIKKARQEIADGKEELEKGKSEYEKSYNEWSANYKTVLKNIKDLDQVKEELDAGKKELDKGWAELEKAKKELDEGEKKIGELEANIIQFQSFLDFLAKTPPETAEEFYFLIGQLGLPEDLMSLISQIPYNEENLPQILGILQTALSDMENGLSEAKKDLKEGKADYEAGLKQFMLEKQKFEQGLHAYEAGKDRLDQAKILLEDGKRQLDQAKNEIERNWEKLAEGEKELENQEKRFKESIADGKAKIEEAKTELADAEKSLKEEREKALKEIAEAEEELLDAEKQIDSIPDNWFVNTRDANPGYSGYGDDAERIGAVAKVFPLFFFLVAALVSLTTMTRMVEEERVQIGTLKALGYKTRTIASKYFIYALFSSGIGTLIGLVVGFRLFPLIIMNAYGIMYNIPDRVTPYHLDYAVISTAIALLSTTLTALAVTAKNLRLTPATLMQPKAPKPGKRIFLERISPVWSRLSFSQKVTFRNIFRYKSRFFMTMFGIAGCTALLLTGYGLRDSINDIMDKQFEEIFLYDGQIVTDTESDLSEEDFLDILAREQEIKAYLPIKSETIEVSKADFEKSYETTLMMPDEPGTLDRYIDLHERGTDKDIALNEEGVVITEKLAGLLDVQTGDTIVFEDTDNRKYEAEVAAIAENYLSHYLYITPELFEKTTGKTAELNGALIQTEPMEPNPEEQFKEKLMDHEGILTVIFLSSIKDQFHDTIASLDYVILVLIISAGALAVVVLYNLTNINITERVREIATIKVLGFYHREVDAYVYRENFILTIFGTLFGLILGVILHKYVIITMEIDSMMFGQSAHLSSYFWSIAMTLAFSGAVNWFMHFKLKNISMVESLKSVD